MKKIKHKNGAETARKNFVTKVRHLQYVALAFSFSKGQLGVEPPERSLIPKVLFPLDMFPRCVLSFPGVSLARDPFSIMSDFHKVGVWAALRE